MAVEQYRIFAYDINTNTLLCELPGNGLTFDTRLNDPGSCSFSLNLKSPGTAKRVAPIMGYEGNPFKVYIDRGGVIVWAGWVLTGNYQKSSGILPIGGKELLAWGDMRVAVKSYDQTLYPAGVDPAELIATVINDAQSVAQSGPGSSIGLNVIAPSSGLPLVSPGYPLSQHSTLNQIIQDMASVTVPGSGGIDVSVTSYWDANGVPVDTLRVWSPRVGRPAGTTGLMFDLVSALDYSWPTDAAQSATTIIATGGGTGSAIPTAIVSAPGVPVGGLGQAPRMDKVVSFSTVQSQQQVSLMANGTAQQYGRPLATPTVTVKTSDPGQPLGSWIVGDDARLYTAGDERFPNGLDEYWRIVQQSVKVPDEGLATVVLTFNRPPIY